MDKMVFVCWWTNKRIILGNDKSTASLWPITESTGESQSLPLLGQSLMGLAVSLTVKIDEQKKARKKHFPERDWDERTLGTRNYLRSGNWTQIWHFITFNGPFFTVSLTLSYNFSPWQSVRATMVGFFPAVLPPFPVRVFSLHWLSHHSYRAPCGLLTLLKKETVQSSSLELPSHKLLLHGSSR